MPVFLTEALKNWCIFPLFRKHAPTDKSVFVYALSDAMREAYDMHQAEALLKIVARFDPLRKDDVEGEPAFEDA